MESKIQSHIIKSLESDGYFVLKLIKTNKNGIPDLIAIKENVCFFVEVKTEKGIISNLQKTMINLLESKNIKVNIWTGYKKNFKNDTTNKIVSTTIDF